MAEILHLDLTTCKVEDFDEFYSDFEFAVNCDCKITAIGVCFDTEFAQGDFHEFVHKPLEPANSLKTNCVLPRKANFCQKGPNFDWKSTIR